MKKKILHIALNDLRQATLCDALASLGSEYAEIDWIRESKGRGHEGFQAYLLDFTAKYKPDIIFMQLQTPGIITPETARQLPGFKINWTGDVRQPLPQWYIDLGREIQLSLFTNMADVDAIRKEGCKADFLQIGFDETIFKKDKPQPARDIDIIFMGNHYGDTFPLSKMRHDMAHMLRDKYGHAFQLYGNSWDMQMQAINLMYNQTGEAATYNRAKIAINISHFDLERYSSDRMLRIMASGAFCLSKWYPGIEKDYKIGKHIDVWHDMDELVEKINYYIHNSRRREAIADAGYKLVHKRDTWGARMKELKKMIR